MHHTLPGRFGILQKIEMQVPLQVAALTCHKITALPPFAALRHLILSTASSADLPIGHVINAPALETLSLGISARGEYADWSLKDMDLSTLHALKHVRIENFAPRELHVPDGCLLHVMWNKSRTDGSKFTQWARVQSLWQAQRNRLGSLQIYHTSGKFQGDKMIALRSLLTGDQELAYISLWILELGNEKQPFLLESGSCQMLALAERVRLYSAKVCSISIVDMQPKWKNLSIDAARVNLEVGDIAGLVRSLDNFRIKAVTTLGFSSLSMIYELFQSGRKCSVNRQTRQAAEGTPQGFAFGSLLSCTTQSQFTALMHCGCSACLPCLFWEAMLSRDSRVPDCGDCLCCRVPVYRF